jgi:hypothetical protein
MMLSDPCAWHALTHLVNRLGLVLHSKRLCKTEAGGESPKTQARGRLKSGLFHARSMALAAPVSMAARVGAPPGAPVPVFRSLNPALGRHPRLRARAAVDDNRNTGAFTMAVRTPGAAAPVSLPALPLRSRTRRLHALLALNGDTAATVHSTRRAELARGVTLTLNSGEQAQAVALVPTEARALACALLSAAEALELVQRHQWPGAVQEGGAA